jgi:hypothetical protein
MGVPELFWGGPLSHRRVNLLAKQKQTKAADHFTGYSF